MKGKEKCEFLKGIRKRMAKANGIPYEPRECTFEGECKGTCPFCEKEAEELMAKLKKIETEGVEIKTDDASILAIELINDYVQKDYQDVDKEEKDIEGELLQGSLVNSRQDISESQLPPIPPSEPLMGDIEFPYKELSEEDKETRALLQDAREKLERERKREINAIGTGD